MKYERLTTDKPQNNKDFLLNFAFVKDGEVYLRGMGDDGEEIRLCDYIAIRATSEKGCERTPQDILDGACNECHCELAALNIVAVQAVELRNRLADLEDKIESGEMLESPKIYQLSVGCKGTSLETYFIDEIPAKLTSINGMWSLEYKDRLCGNGGRKLIGYFTDKYQAEAKLKELQGE